MCATVAARPGRSWLAAILARDLTFVHSFQALYPASSRRNQRRARVKSVQRVLRSDRRRVPTLCREVRRIAANYIVALRVDRQTIRRADCAANLSLECKF